MPGSVPHFIVYGIHILLHVMLTVCVILSLAVKMLIIAIVSSQSVFFKNNVKHVFVLHPFFVILNDLKFKDNALKRG